MHEGTGEQSHSRACLEGMFGVVSKFENAWEGHGGTTHRWSVSSWAGDTLALIRWD